MRACVVENGVITNVINVEEADMAAFNAVDLGEYAYIGDTVVDGVCVESAARELERKTFIKREKRNELLNESDIMVAKEMEANGSVSQALKDYRQALRDLPAQDGFPEVDFPTKP